MPSQRRPAARTSRPVSSKSSGVDGVDAGTRVDRRADVEADDVRALAGEGDRRGAANPAGGAGDHGDLASQASV